MTDPSIEAHSRAAFGPADATYVVGDFVSVWFSQRESQGLVTAVHPCPDGTIYEVHTLPGGPGACVGAESMRREIKPEIGQRWVANTGHTLNVRRFDTDTAPAGLVAVGDRPGQRVILSSPHWALIVSGPHRPTSTVRHCDIGGEPLDGSWWLLRAVGRGWENEHGAACARHAGQGGVSGQPESQDPSSPGGA